jgi:signal transduction histidine kinase/CheY-like chemotaxis protein
MNQQVISDGINLEFLAGGGTMGERIRAYPWARTVLGEPQFWPQGLRTAVRVLLTTQHPMFIFWGHEHTCLYNDAYGRSLGPEKHPAILGTPGRQSWEEIWPIIGPQIEQVMRGEGATWHENQLVPIIRHGELQDVYWTYSYSPIDEPEFRHGVGGVLVICTETTEQVLAEQRLSAERERFVQLFDQAPTFLALLRGPDHVIELANPGYLKLIGHRSVVGRKLADALPDAVAQGYLALLDEVYRTGKPFSAYGAKYAVQVLPEGPINERYVDFVYQPITDSDGSINGVLVLGVDATDRTLAEQALREGDRRKDEFLATLAHELRNPLAPIRTAAQILASPRLSSQQLQWAQSVIQRQAGKMALLLDDLLDIARITQGKLELKVDRVRLTDVVDSAVEEARPLLDGKNHQLTVTLPAEELTLQADPLRLSQILSNLLNNAAKYTDPAGHIELSACVKNGEVCLSVRDNGIGIAPGALSRIFKMFSQIDGGAARSEGGLGIGLALVKGLLDLHGGRIEARSPGPGQGSEFIMHLPFSASTAAGAPASANDIPPVATMGRRVMVVDDNKDAADALAMLLEMSGHEVRVAHRGRAALTLAQTFRPEVAIIDLGMPDLSGYDVAKELRRESWGADICLIALTGWGRDDDRHRSKGAGFDRHMTKPVEPGELDALLLNGSGR